LGLFHKVFRPFLIVPSFKEILLPYYRFFGYSLSHGILRNNALLKIGFGKASLKKRRNDFD